MVKIRKFYKSKRIILFCGLIVLLFLSYIFFFRPANYNLEQIHLTLNESSFDRLADIRERAIEKGYLEREADDYVPAEINYLNQVVSAEARLKGDYLDHLGEEKWSFRIKLDDPMEDGLQIFSVQDPSCRGHLKAYVFYHLMRENGVVSNEFRIIELVVNGESWGVYFLEEHLSSRMIADSNRPPGVILKLRDQEFFEATIQEKSTKGLIATAEIKMYGDLKKSDKHKTELAEANQIIWAYQVQEPNVYDRFDPEVMGKYYALCDLTCAHHAMGWINMRFYYNFSSKQMEPIAYDPYPILDWGKPYLGANYESYENDSLDTKKVVFKALENDSIRYYYNYYLNAYLENDLMGKFLANHEEELMFFENELQKEHFSYEFDQEFFLEHVVAIRVAKYGTAKGSFNKDK